MTSQMEGKIIPSRLSRRPESPSSMVDRGILQM